MEGLLLSCQISGIRSLKDRSISVTLETQELSSGKAGELFSLRNKIAAVYISSKEHLTDDEISKVDQANPDFPTKSQSQRIRDTLFRAWEKRKEGYNDFDSYYRAKTELYISHIKSKIEK
jgi:hypothetical protein